MITRRFGLAAALISMMALVSSQSGERHRPPAEPVAVNFSIMSTEGRQTQMDDWGPFPADMEKGARRAG